MQLSKYKQISGKFAPSVLIPSELFVKPRNFLRKVSAMGQNDCFSKFKTPEFIKWENDLLLYPFTLGFRLHSLKVFDLKFKYIKTIFTFNFFGICVLVATDNLFLTCMLFWRFMLRLQVLTISTFPSSRAVGGNISELILSCSQLGTEHSSVIPLHMILRDNLKAGLHTN